jgi:hypothetical protein
MQWMFTHNLRLHPMEGECLYEYVAMPRPIVFSVQLWRVIMSLYTFQNIERFFGCCCRGWDCKQNFQNTMAIRIQVFVYWFQCLTKMTLFYLVCGI